MKHIQGHFFRKVAKSKDKSKLLVNIGSIARLQGGWHEAQATATARSGLSALASQLSHACRLLLMDQRTQTAGQLDGPFTPLLPAQRPQNILYLRPN